MSEERMHSEGYSSRFVCLSVCVSTLILVLGGLLTIPAAAELREPENKRAIFLKRLCSRDNML